DSKSTYMDLIHSSSNGVNPEVSLHLAKSFKRILKNDLTMVMELQANKNWPEAELQLRRALSDLETLSSRVSYDQRKLLAQPQLDVFLTLSETLLSQGRLFEMEDLMRKVLLWPESY